MVTAELALAVPAVVCVVVALAWLLSLSVAQGLVTQAAREGARAAARGASESEVRVVVQQVVPGAQTSLRSVGGTVVVTAVSRRTPPVRILRPLARDLRASATSWRER